MKTSNNPMENEEINFLRPSELSLKKNSLRICYLQGLIILWTYYRIGLKVDFKGKG